MSQHYTNKNITPSRWNVFISDRGWNSIQLTKNIQLFTFAVDPEFIPDRSYFIKEVTPLIYEHLCIQRWITTPNPRNCIEALEDFSQQTIIGDKPQIFYTTSWSVLLTWSGGIWITWSVTSWDNDDTFQQLSWQLTLLKEYNDNANQIISWFTTWQAYQIIGNRLGEMVVSWERDLNFVWFYELPQILEKIRLINKPYIVVKNNNYIYIKPSLIESSKEAAKELQWLFGRSDLESDQINRDLAVKSQPNRYVKLLWWVSNELANKIQLLKIKSQTEFKTMKRDDRLRLKVPRMHWMILEKSASRYYPFNNFMSHILWYVKNTDWNWIYWIEEYFNDKLKWTEWRIVWFGSQWIWDIGSNELIVQQAKDGMNVYLTIDPTIQKEIEKIIKEYAVQFRADSVSALLINPFNGQVVASANYPDFNPNSPQDIYQVKPLWPSDRYLTTDITYVDHPIYYNSWWRLLPTNVKERFNLSIPKYIHEKTLWPTIFYDKNITLPYEPWSIFKALTMWIGLDTDEISLWDYYFDKWQLQIWPYTIKNVDRRCMWTNTFLHALQFSCNVWMIRILQRVRDQVFYNYLEKFGFWRPTWIELAWEAGWDIPDVETVSRTQFYNNAFGQWLTATPIQMAVAFSTLVNGWYVVKPTVVDRSKTSQLNPGTKIPYNPPTKRILKQTTSDSVRLALFEVANGWQIRKFSIPGYSIGWKTWTSQISYRWKYQNWAWRTNWSFAWIITKNNLKYVIVIQIRRPRQSLRWELTAGRIFADIAKFVIMYEGIQK